MRLLSFIAAGFVFVTAASAETLPQRPDARDAEARRPESDVAGPIAQGDQDIGAMAMIVLMEAAKAAQNDLRDLMAAVKAANDAKKRQRAQQQATEAMDTGNPCTSRGAVAWRLCVQEMRRKLTRMDLAALDVMRGAARQSEKDVRTLMSSLQGAAREQLRGDAPPARTLPSDPCAGWNLAMFKACLAAVEGRLAGNLPDRESDGLVRADLERIYQNLDAMGDLMQLHSVRLQAAVESLAKLMDTLSNVLKKISETQSAITQNLK